MKKMKISIIMAVRNSENTVESSLLSLIRQDYKDKEIIVVDGASTDNTLEIIKRYSDAISILISEPDRNSHDAINKGIRASSGEIIGILNSDDWYVNAHVLSSVSEKFDSNAEVLCENLFLQRNDMWRRIKSNNDLSALYSHCSIPILASFFRKSVFYKYGFLDEKYAFSGDYEFWFRLYKGNAKLQFSDEYTTLMFDGGNSADPRKGCYAEDRKILISYGVPSFKANVSYWYHMMRHTMVRLFQKMKIDNIVKSILGKEAFLTVDDMKGIGVNIETPWFTEAGEKNQCENKFF